MKQMKRHGKRGLSLFLIMALLIGMVTPISRVKAEGSAGFALAEGGKVPDILVYEEDEPQILRAVGDLQNDMQSVTGQKPELKYQEEAAGALAIIVGSIEKNPVIRRLMDEGKLDEAKELEGKQEAFVLKVVQNPVSGMDKALVIAGSDKRGAIYGIYELSERIGVSPYYWWGDVPIERQSTIILPDEFVYQEGESSVKYRGIFINDEFNLWEWSAKLRNDTDSPGQLNPATYAKVFELLLRLKMNTLWPAMHEQGDEFYKYTDKGPFAEDGTPLNAKLADEYGIVIGTSHCEPLLTCPAEEEWTTWCERNYGKYDAQGLPVYDYSINPQAVMAYWRERVEATKDYEAIYTLGMRGRHDGEMAYAGLSDKSLAGRVALLQKIIDDQREMLQEVLGKPIEEIPQAFIPYKEAATYYNAGLNLPDDVIMMWAEDNQGQLRQVPTEKERERSGGAGVYYHVSVYGSPNSYLWVSTTPNVHMYEELRRAYDTGQSAYWILNVGDIKPAEVSLEFFAELGRNIDRYNDANIGEFYQEISKRDYGTDDATGLEIADIMNEYYQLASAKRPEYMGLWNADYMQEFSRVNNGDEAQIHINRMNALFDRAKAVYDGLDADRKDAFYQMIYYPIRSAKYMLEWTEYQKMNQLCSKQGRYRSTTAYQKLSEYAYQCIQNDLVYYNKVLSDGKWDGIMAPVSNGTRIPSIAQPHQVTYASAPAPVDALGSVCEGQTQGDENVTLSFSSLTDDKRFIDIFTRDDSAKDYTITTSDDFIVPSQDSGTVTIEQRIWVSIDWDQLETVVHTGTVTVTGPGLKKTYQLTAEKFDLSDSKYSGADYIQSNGYVAIEAEHFSDNIKVGEDEWRVVENWGRVGDAMRVYPHANSRSARIESNLTENSARLEYKVYFNEAGTYSVTFYRNPTLNEGNYDDGEGKSARTAVSIDGQEPINGGASDQYFRGVRAVYKAGTVDDFENNWKRMAYARCEKLTANIVVDSPGVHTVTIYKIDASIGFDRIVIAPSSMKIADSSYFGPPESYNAKYETYEAEYGILPDLETLPEVSQVGKSWFSFGASVNQYINVSNTRIYNGENGYGWDEETSQQTDTGGNKVCERDRQYQYGESERTFTVNLVSTGKYMVGITIGHRGTNTSRDINDMNIRVNGELKLTDIQVPSGASTERYMIVDLNDTTEMAITFSGSPWAVTALEIAPYREPETEGDSEYFLGYEGTVYIEAEAALEESEYAYTKAGSQGTSWTQTAGASGTAMFHGPNSDTIYNPDNQTAMEEACSMNYQVLFDQPGDYRVWVLRRASSADDDSFHFGLDGQYQFTDNNDPEYMAGVFRWRDTGKTIHISDISQPHTITIAGREDGIVIDKIYLRRIAGSSWDIDWPCFQGATMRRSGVTVDDRTYATLNVSSDEITADFNVGNRSERTLDVSCLLADYEENGMLGEFKQENVSVEPGSASKLQMAMPSKGKTPKAFIWDANTLAPLFADVVNEHEGAGSTEVTVIPDTEDGAVQITIKNPDLAGEDVSVVCYSPGWNQEAKDLGGNLEYVSILDQVTLDQNGETTVVYPLKGEVITGAYTLVVGSGADGQPVEQEFDFEFPADTTKLVEAIETYGSLKETDYTADSWRTFVTALAKAKEAADKEKVTQEEVTAALQALTEAYKGLKPYVPVVIVEEVSKTELGNAVSVEETFKASADKNQYTAESWANYEKALEKAWSMFRDPKATQAQVTSAKNALTAARKGLVPLLGKTFLYKKGVYKITKLTQKNKTVTYVRPVNKKQTKLTIPKVVRYQGMNFKVTKIAAKACKNNKKLRSVTIGANIKEIGASAFQGAKNLRNVTFKGKAVSKIGKKAFKGIHRKVKVKLPKKLSVKARKKLMKAMKL